MRRIKHMIIISSYIILVLMANACGGTGATVTTEPTTETSTESTHNLKTSVYPSNGGTINPASGTYEDGTEVTLTAMPAQGYVFDHWSGAATGTSSSITVKMDSAKYIIAHFKVIVWEVTVVSVRTTTRLEGERNFGKATYYTAETGYTFLVVELLINNISTESQSLGYDSFSITHSKGKLDDCDGYKTEDLFNKGYVLGYIWVRVIPPGEFSIDIVFIVPNDATDFVFKFYDLPEIDLVL